MKMNSKIIAELDRVFSIYIRTKYADRLGYAKCYTCGALMHWSKLHNGHFYSRRFFSTRWNENNCRPQCFKCNVALGGNLAVYSEKLLEELGTIDYENLRIKHNEIANYTSAQLKLILNNYLEKLQGINESHNYF